MSDVMPLNPSASKPAPARRRHAVLAGSRVALRAAIVLVLALWSLLLLAWLTLHWGILPHIDDWRPTIEQRASEALGLPVRIGRITVRTPGWVPALELSDVVLADRQGREALRLPKVSAAVSPQSLLIEGVGWAWPLPTCAACSCTPPQRVSQRRLACCTVSHHTPHPPPPTTTPAVVRCPTLSRAAVWFGLGGWVGVAYAFSGPISDCDLPSARSDRLPARQVARATTPD